VAIPLTIFVIVGVTNATNLSDGLDGLAGGMALLIFSVYRILRCVRKRLGNRGDSHCRWWECAWFLRFNSYPAQLFMGDAGSQFLGFVAVVLLVKLAQQSAAISVFYR
jgi:UDP-GlcNAc:undecaprenyl-phosphate GlcNAc-1-phosphate transferase